MMKKLLDARGLTLVEVLVSTALLSIVLLIITSFHIFGQNQFNNQDSQAERISNVRLAMSDMTKEIRKAPFVTECGPGKLLLGDVSYKLEHDHLVKHNTLFVKEIKSFSCEEISSGSEVTGVTITISSTQPGQGSQASYTSEIYFRK
ncbi:PilW family protein [Evansella clarkii]|uniref:PilW family protein n=1 Tax=Evansella clarkii TaxID=79879 RepID=UPI0009981DCC|nr:prepilin-type N-terminal cleavage/methylation domain-containing protein [Evansella clarkii]